jgi:hypothetical protein
VQKRGLKTIKASRRIRIGIPVACFVIYFLVHFAFLSRANSITWDEPDHTYAGYMSWKHADFGLNPQHPPLVKYLATIPLLSMKLQEPVRQDRPYRIEEVIGGRNLVFRNDADTMVFRDRMAASLLTLLLVVLVFLAAQEMFGTGAGFVTLGLLAFDPTLLAHGALVTTDAGQASFLFAAIYAFYRYIKAPSAGRLALTGISAGLALASKHSAVLLFPMLVVLAGIEVIWHRRSSDDEAQARSGKDTLRLVGALGMICAISVLMLWASYGFRFAARGEGLKLNPPFQAMLQRVPSAGEAHMLAIAEKLQLLPESYLYGFAHVLYQSKAFTSFVLGTIYPHPVWFYFPVAMLIKSTLTFLVLLAITIWAIARGKVPQRRELAFMLVPAAIYMAFAMAGGMNIGIRHILPVYIFLAVAIGGAAWALIQSNRFWLYGVVALLILQAISVGRCYPAYMVYANEAAGGPVRTHELLSDSSADWGQQLKAVKQYLDRHGIKDCWFAYFGEGVIDYRYYGIPCRPLPTADGLHFADPVDTPPAVDGPVLVSASVLSGFEFGPGKLNPYEQFKRLTPTAAIDYSVFVYDGHFEIPLACALSHVQKAEILLRQQKPADAMSEAQQAIELAPDSPRTNANMGAALDATGRRDEAERYYAKALELAKSTEPRFQESMIAGLEKRLGK